MSLYAKILAVAILPLVIFFSIGLFQLHRTVDSYQSALNQHYALKTRNVQKGIDQILSQMKTAASVLSELEEIAVALQRSDNEKLFDMGQRFIFPIDSVTFSDLSGLVVARAPDEYRFGDTLAGEPYFKKALDQGTFFGFARIDGFDSFVLSKTIPRYDDLAIGVVCIAIHITTDLLTSFSDSPDLIVEAVINGHSIKSSDQHMPVVYQTSLDNSVNALFRDQIRFRLYFGEDPYYAKLLNMRKHLYTSSILMVFILIACLIVILNRQLKPYSIIVGLIYQHARKEIDAATLKNRLIDLKHTTGDPSSKIVDSLVKMLDVMDKNFQQIENYAFELEQTNQMLETSLENTKASEINLRAGEERLQLVIKGSSDAPWDWDLTRNELYYSPQWWRQLGYEPDELNADAALWERLMHPEDKETVTASFKHALEKDLDSYEVEYRLLHKAGHYVPVLARGFIQRDINGKPVRVAGTNMDLTERKKREAALKNSDQRYRSAQRMGQVGNWEYELKTGNFWGSDQAKQIYGFPRDSEYFTTEAVESCIPDRERVHQALVDLIEKNKPYDIEFEICPASSPKRKVVRSLAELQTDESGRPCKVLGVVQDITQRKAAEIQRQQLELQLLQAQKIKAIGTLAGGIAHDFNNILYPIIGFAEMSIQDLPGNHPVQENLQDILQGAKRARDLVKQILAFSRQGDFEYRPLVLQPIIEETLRLLRAIIPSNITIQKDLSENKIYMVANPTEFHEVIMNICTNAYHAMEKKGGVLTVLLTEATPDPDFYLTGERYCCLTIRDTGMGIPEAIINNIYDPYFTTKDQGKGSGLGLSVVHGIIKSYKGAIDIQSQEKKGTTVRIFLPIIQEPESAQTDLSAPSDNSGHETILLVDDEPAIVKLGTRMLERSGYSVQGKTSSIDALELFKSNPTKFDLVITDMTMPNLLGIDLAKKILKIRKDMPILICTGFSERVDPQTAEAFGIQGYINKPLLMDELIATVRELLDRHRQVKQQ